MHETLDAIQNKLNPQRLKHQAQEAIREATIGRAEDTMSKAVNRAEDAVSGARETAMDAGTSMMDTIRENPIPAALASIGIGWLLMNRSEGQRSRGGYYGDTSSYYARQARMTPSSEYSYEGYRPEDESRSGEMAETAGEKVGEMREAATEMMDEVRSRAGDVMGETGERFGRTGTGVLDTIKENPLPAAIAGFGLGWLFMNSGSRPESRYPQFRSRYATERYVGPYGDYYGEEGGTSEDIRGKAQEAMGQAQETVGDIAGKAQETVGEVTDQVQERMGHMARRTRYEYGRIEDRFQESLNSNPLAIGAAALAAGAAAAMLLPGTLQERRFMGEARDNLVGQVQSAAKETMGKVERVAERVQDTAKQEAREEGLAE
jgi:uncharacterized protein YjbJ (UPF0337 family)